MRILLAEDEKDLSRALSAVLEHEGFSVDAVYDGKSAVEKAKKNSYDCMVFDIMMPVMDGVGALQTIRRAGDVTPVILLTAKSEIEDRITGLDAGADDYLTKPFAMGELLARIRSQIRRSGRYAEAEIAVGLVRLNTSEQELRVVNAVRLSGKETDLMELFMRNPGKCFRKEEILEKIWRNEPDSDPKLVWVYISYLRDKLAALGADIAIAEKRDGFLLEKSCADTAEDAG